MYKPNRKPDCIINGQPYWWERDGHKHIIISESPNVGMYQFNIYDSEPWDDEPQELYEAYKEAHPNLKYS